VCVTPAVPVRVCRVGAASLRVVAAILVAVLIDGVASAAAASPVLFPGPLHITREVSDPVTATTTVVDEYCHGNRIVSISGSRTAIVDHDKGLVTVIDTATGTWSEARFEEIARVQARSRRASASAGEWRREERPSRVIASRPGDSLELSRAEAHGNVVVQLTLDRQLALSRPAMEALLGTGHPNPADSMSDAVIGALRVRGPRVAVTASDATASSEPLYQLPLEHTVRFDVGGEIVETRNVVTRIGTELPPPDRLAVPPGARKVELPLIAAIRLLEELDQPPRRVP
jgi:hypothetical protein